MTRSTPTRNRAARRTAKVVALGAAAAAAGAAALGLYRATHPPEASGPISPDPGRRRRPLGHHLFDLPPGVMEGDVPTPDGGSIHYAELGEGRPLVLLHGVTLRHDVWAPQFHQLADRYRVISVDLRGHGRSEVGALGLGLPRLATDLATLLEALDLRDAVVVGHSMGGMTVMQFCGDHPDVLGDRVAAIALVATAAHQAVPPYLEGAMRRLLTTGKGQVERGAPLPTRRVVSRPTVRLVFGDQPHPRAVDVVHQMTTSMHDAHLIDSLLGVVEHDARDALRATRTPSIVVVGTRDVLTPVPAGRALARLLPGSELVVLPRAGHQLMQERPDELAELIDALVARVEGTAASVADAVAADDRPVEADQVEAVGEPL